MGKDKKVIKKAVCAFILNFNGKILTVSRKDDPNDIGLPGGKVNTDSFGIPIESEIEALKREVLEETGFTVNVISPLYSAKDKQYLVTTYLAVIDHKVPYKELSPDETGIVRMLKPKALLQSSFRSYNKVLLKTLNLL